MVHGSQQPLIHSSSGLSMGGCLSRVAVCGAGGERVMTGRRRNQSLGEMAVKPTFRIIDGVSIRFVESDPGNTDALLLSPWPESIMAYEPIWLRLAETTHLVAID